MQVRPNQGDSSALVVYTTAFSVSSTSITDRPGYFNAGSKSHPFDVVDPHPYASAAPFLEPVIRCTSDDDLLCMKCTYLPVLCCNQPEYCFSRY